MTDKCPECPICYTPYGEQEDGSILPKDGKNNSDKAADCKHYFCVKCIIALLKTNIETWGDRGWQDANIKCPLCREDWTMFILDRYEDEITESDLED